MIIAFEMLDVAFLYVFSTCSHIEVQCTGEGVPARAACSRALGIVFFDSTSSGGSTQQEGNRGITCQQSPKAAARALEIG